MDYESSKNNLIEYIYKLKSFESGESTESFTRKYVLDLARERGYEVVGVTDSTYIKKGYNPRAILHLNIDTRSDGLDLEFTNDDLDEYSSGRNFYLANALLVITILINQSLNDFDILITNNNIQKDNHNYSSLENIIRSDNVINLNLRQAQCIADEFSSLNLSNIKVPIERFEPDYGYQAFDIRLENLIGGRAGEDIDKVRLNSIKTIIGFIRKIKAKVDLDVTGFEAGDRYDNLPSMGDLYFIIKDEYENELYDIFDLFKNELIEKNLKHEPDMKLSLIKMEEEYSRPLTETSFNHLASFVELIPTGAFSFDADNDLLISSLNLAIARSFAEYISFIVVYRSLSDEAMDQMLEKTDIAMKISDSSVQSSFKIPRWKNKDDTLTETFRHSYGSLTEEDLLVIKTQYSLDASVIFSDLDVKMVSLGVKYKQGDDGKYYTKLIDLVQTANLIDSALSHL